MWLDNCSGQNKCWTLFTTLVQLVNEDDGPNKITFKYFVAGHTFMSADSFHRKVEKEMKQMGKVCDFMDFTRCIQRAGDAVIMQLDDFKMFENGLSQSKASKESRPRLENVSVAEFRKGSYVMHFKETHVATEFKQANFLKKKLKRCLELGGYVVAEKWKEPRGVPEEKKRHIIES